MMDSFITNWKSVDEKLRKENEIRQEYADRIEAAQKRLFDYKQSQKGNAKGVLMRQAASGDSALVGEVFAYLCKEPQQRKADEEAAKKLKEIEAKLAAQAGKNKDNAKAVLMRNLAQGDNMLMDVCLEAWKGWLADYKKNKDTEDAIKAQEAKVAEFMKNKSDGAKSMVCISTLSFSGQNSAGLSVCCDITRCVWSQRNISFRACRTCSEPSPHSSSKVSRMGHREIRLRSRTAARR